MNSIVKYPVSLMLEITAFNYTIVFLPSLLLDEELLSELVWELVVDEFSLLDED